MAFDRLYLDVHWESDVIGGLLLGAIALVAATVWLDRPERPRISDGAPNSAVLIMVTTGGRNDAERLGEALVVEHLAGCCSVIPTVHSFYYWEGQLKREHEALLLVKTVESRAAAVQEYVRTHHEYELPEILQIAVEGGSPDYLNWLADQVTQQAR